MGNIASIITDNIKSTHIWLYLYCGIVCSRYTNIMYLKFADLSDDGMSGTGMCFVHLVHIAWSIVESMYLIYERDIGWILIGRDNRHQDGS